MEQRTKPIDVRKGWKWYANWQLADGAFTERTFFAVDLEDATRIAKEYAPKRYRTHLLTLDEVGPFPTIEQDTP